MVPTGAPLRNHFLSASGGHGPGERKKGRQKENRVKPEGPGAHLQ